ncbi:MAG: hypothetical protein PVF73_13165 [Bacteroidales bacterium]
MNKTIIVLACILLTLLSSCKRKAGRHNGDCTVDLQIDRFEKDLFSIDIYSLKDSIFYLQRKYPDFLPLFNNKIIEIGDMNQPHYADRLIAFVTDFTIYHVNQRVNEVFFDFSVIENNLSDAFGRYACFFPDRSVPRIITCITGFNQSIVTADSMLVLGLDKYLGSEDEFYKLMYPPIPQYMRYVMRPEKVSSDALYAWLTTEFEYNDKKDDLLSNIVFKGRAIYLVKELMPDIPDTLLWGFTPGQLEFCHSNEKEMWEYLIGQKKLFVTDKMVISQYVDEGPFTKDFSQDSPGRTGVWLGSRIVLSYMKNNRDVTFSDLMNETDYLKILNLSKYDP